MKWLLVVHIEWCPHRSKKTEFMQCFSVLSVISVIRTSSLISSPDCWAVSQTLRSWVPQACSPPMLSLSRGCWRTRLPLEAAQETVSVPHSSTAASSLSTCTRWQPTHLTGQWTAETRHFDPWSKTGLFLLRRVWNSVLQRCECPTNFTHCV